MDGFIETDIVLSDHVTRYMHAVDGTYLYPRLQLSLVAIG